VGPASGQLLARVAALPPHTIVLFQLAPDSSLPAFGALDLLTAVAERLPTYSALPSLCLNYGCIGGAYEDWPKERSWTAEVAARVLLGDRLEDIPVVHASDLQVRVDWRALRRWHIPESALPAGSQVLYREPTLWERYKRYIVGSICLILAQTLLILALLWQHAKRRRVEKSLLERLTFETLLSDLSTTFINLPDEQVDANIEKSLGGIAEFLKINQVMIHESARDKAELRMPFAWQREEVSAVPPL